MLAKLTRISEESRFHPWQDVLVGAIVDVSYHYGVSFTASGCPTVEVRFNKLWLMMNRGRLPEDIYTLLMTYDDINIIADYKRIEDNGGSDHEKPNND